MAIQITAAMEGSSQDLKETSNCTGSVACVSTDRSHTRGYTDTCPPRTSLSPSPCIALLSTTAEEELSQKRHKKYKACEWISVTFARQEPNPKLLTASLPTGGAWRPPCLSPRAEGHWWAPQQEGKSLHIHWSVRWVCFAVFSGGFF